MAECNSPSLSPEDSFICRSLGTPTTIRSEAEFDLLLYYANSFISFLLLPSANTKFYNDYVADVINLALKYEGVKCAVLACCATNKYMKTNDIQYRQLGMAYYSRAMEDANKSIERFDPTSQSSGDALLTTVVYCYIHALWGRDSAADAANHVAGAITLLSLRYSSTSLPLSMAQPFDRITAESVIYQAFLLSMRHPFSMDFDIDDGFLSRTEKILKPLTFSEASAGLNSPVLGAPLPLYRLILKIIQLYNSSEEQDPIAFAELKTEMASWEWAILEMEEPVLSSKPSPQDTDETYADIAALYILAGSLLLDSMVELRTTSPCNDLLSISGEPVPTRWQLTLGLSIIRRPSGHEKWTRLFLGPWPMLIFGYVVDTQEDILTIKTALQQMQQYLGYGEIERTLLELESVWKQKETTMRGKNSPPGSL